MLGSGHEADDAVQETWLRLHRSEGIDNLGGWLTTVVSRVCLDMLRSRSSRREDELGGVRRHRRTTRTQGHPEFEAELADSVGTRPGRRTPDAGAGRTTRVRPARPVRGALRRHRHDHRPLPRRHPSAGQPCSPSGAAARGARRDRRPRDRGRVPRGLAQRRVRATARAARPGRRRPCRRRRRADGLRGARERRPRCRRDLRRTGAHGEGGGHRRRQQAPPGSAAARRRSPSASPSWTG